MAKSRRANAVNFGFDFQVNATIFLLLDNIKELKTNYVSKILLLKSKKMKNEKKIPKANESPMNGL